MAKLTIKKGSKYHRDIKFGKEQLKHENNIRKSLSNHGREVKKELVKVVSTGARTGRIYMYKGTPYRASAPGEPPAKRSGDLSRGFAYKTRPNELRIGNTVFSEKGFPYPLALVTGTVKMSPRPYFITTIERLHGRLQADLQRGKI